MRKFINLQRNKLVKRGVSWTGKTYQKNTD